MADQAAQAATDPGVILAVERRNGLVQAVHTGHAVVVDASGNVIHAWGHPDSTHFWRSSAKPLQAIPFAAECDALGLGDRELAVACGSHGAEPFHLQAVRRILDAAGLDETALKCGAHDPGPVAGSMPPGGWTAFYNNCSGKHAAMLAVCVRRSWATESYLDPSHPLQKEIRMHVARGSGILAEGIPWGVDGCGLPTFYLSLEGLARAFRWLVVGGDPDARRVVRAMGTYPEMVAGTKQCDSDVMAATGGQVVGKYGALGIQAFVHVPTGQALAVRCVGGNAAAAKAVAADLAAQLGWIGITPAVTLREHVRPQITNHAGLVLGELEPVLRI